MKICVDIQGEDSVYIPTIRIPNALLRSKTGIRKLLQKAEIEMDETTIEKIVQVTSQYIRHYKGRQLLEAEVFSKDGEYVHVEISL